MLTRALRQPWQLLALLSAVIVAFLTLREVALRTDAMWDFSTYYRAAAAFASGLDPYDAKNLPDGLPYVYPPIILLVFRPLTWLPLNQARHLYFASNLVALIVLMWTWGRFFLRNHFDSLFVLFAWLGFNATIYTGLLSGNVSLFEQLALWFAFANSLRGRHLSFALWVVAAAAFKLLPLAFLGLLLVSEGPGRWRAFLIGVAAFGAYLATSWVLWPGFFADFLRTASGLDERGVINPCSLALFRDLAALAAPKSWAVWLANGVVPYVGFVLVVGAVSVVALRKAASAQAAEAARLRVYLACFAYAVAAPRFKNYSYVLLLVPLYHLVVEGKRSGSLALLLLAAVLPLELVFVPGPLVALAKLAASYLSWIVALLGFGWIVREVATRPEGAPRSAPEGAP